MVKRRVHAGPVPPRHPVRRHNRRLRGLVYRGGGKRRSLRYIHRNEKTQGQTPCRPLADRRGPRIPRSCRCTSVRIRRVPTEPGAAGQRSKGQRGAGQHKAGHKVEPHIPERGIGYVQVALCSRGHRGAKADSVAGNGNTFLLGTRSGVYGGDRGLRLFSQDRPALGGGNRKRRVCARKQRGFTG